MTDDGSAAARFCAHSVTADPAPVRREPAAFRLAAALSRILPRAKGASARLIGRFFLPGAFAVGTQRGFDLVATGRSLDIMVWLRNSGGWTDYVLDACLGLLEPGRVFYDIGANLGYVSLGAAAVVPDAEIHAFEPLPAFARTAARGALRNGFANVRVHAAALDRKDGTARLYLPAHAIHTSFVARSDRAEAVDVPTFRLDTLIAAGALPPPDVVKMDVEGAEMRVIDGAAETLAAHRPALVYECDQNAERFGHTPRDVLCRLAGLGYSRFERIDGEARIACTPDQDDDIPPGDFVATAG